MERLFKELDEELERVLDFVNDSEGIDNVYQAKRTIERIKSLVEGN